jgi:predicted RecB family nuclease
MHRSGSDLILSATDLAAFSGCGHRTWLDHARAHGLIERERFEDKRLELLQKRGIEHEDAYLRRLEEEEGKRVKRFGPLQKDEYGDAAAYRRRHEETLAAMREGWDVIYQGTLFDGRWLGLVDFLVRVERPAAEPSALGAWSYEVADAKLTRHAKASAVLQTCVYSEMLAEAQGARPERIHLYLGGPTPRLATFRLAHFAAYQRSLAGRMGEHLAAAPGAAPDLPVAPDPVELCQMCDWRGRCRDERVEVDHLSLVAGIRADQRRALERAGVTTLAGLAAHPLDAPPEGLRAASFQRVREQARVQLEGRIRDEPVHELLPLERDPAGPALGLAALPEPTPHDWFFDFEGADYAYDEGLEYLWGISDVDDGYRGVWALTQDEEKAALERFLADAVAHVEAHPGAHIYHFGHYEPTALKRLVGRYGVGTDALDGLLRREVFVDLHRIARQGVRASVESYSLKALEPHFDFRRTVPMEEANPARYRLEYALALGLRDDEALADRDTVERYNRDDCVATRTLRDWLEGLRSELEAREGARIPRPTPPEDREAGDEDEAGEIAELMEALLDGVPEAPEERLPGSAEGVRWLAAHLLEWHRREDKTAWWEYFRLRDLSVDELVEETTPLAGLEYMGVMRPEASSLIHRFTFPPQEHRIEAGNYAKEPAREEGESDKGRMVWQVDDGEGWIELKVGQNKPFEPEALRVLLRDEIVGTDALRAQLRKTARHLLEGVDALAGWSPVSLALLRGTAPRFGPDGTGLTDVAPGAALLDRAREAALRLDAGSVLPIQGPPGTGKTYSGARMIRALLRAGLRVGVTGPSHKVISNLLDAVCEADEDDERTTVVGLQVSKDEHCEDHRITRIDSSGKAPATLADRAGADAEGPPFNLVAGTAWLWSREDMEGSVDVLFVDEAGQFSLANAVAVAPAAPRMVLLGDPQQLNQPLKGIHPPGAEVSVLEHLAGEDGILTAEQGLFLAETWRMRPEITAFTSELFYEGKLRSRPDLGEQRIGLADGSRLEGLHFEAVAHQGNSRESEEEARAVVEIFRRLLATGATFTDREGETHPLTVADLLVVAPYNAQVDRIRRALETAGFRAPRVGTVDKFQGQEAPVAIYSLASSSAEDAPRGMEFLYALDRLNVATSRARVATLVVASPRVLTAECRRPEQMRMVNAVVRYGEMARG